MKRKKTINIPIENDEENRPGGDPGEPVDDTAEIEAGEIEEEIAESEVEAEDLVDHLRRLQAEFENYKRRTQKEKMEVGSWAQADLMTKILPALDDLDRAADAVDESGTATVEGFLMARDKLHQALAQAGLEKISAQGSVFDPNLHEALLRLGEEGAPLR